MQIIGSQAPATQPETRIETVPRPPFPLLLSLWVSGYATGYASIEPPRGPAWDWIRSLLTLQFPKARSRCVRTAIGHSDSS